MFFLFCSVAPSYLGGASRSRGGYVARLRNASTVFEKDTYLEFIFGNLWWYPSTSARGVQNGERDPSQTSQAEPASSADA